MANDETQHGPRVAVATLGCKANQYESGRMAMEFAARGCEVVEDTDTADILVINTCTVGVALRTSPAFRYRDARDRVRAS